MISNNFKHGQRIRLPDNTIVEVVDHTILIDHAALANTVRDTIQSGSTFVWYRHEGLKYKYWYANPGGIVLIRERRKLKLPGWF
jgi:hypothetical protein